MIRHSGCPGCCSANMPTPRRYNYGDVSVQITMLVPLFNTYPSGRVLQSQMTLQLVAGLMDRTNRATTGAEKGAWAPQQIVDGDGLAGPRVSQSAVLRVPPLDM